MRQAEHGSAERALSATQDAVRLAARRRDEDGRTLFATARSNEFHFAFLARQQLAQDLPATNASPTLAWIDAVAGEGLSSYLDDHFKAFFDDPYSRTISFRSVDTSDQSMLQALLRSEAVGYRQATLRLRKALGEYRLLSRAGEPGLGAVSGFALLRRAGDASAVKRALGVFRASGPLEVLKVVGESVSESSWLPPELRADLEIIAGSAATFSPSSAAATYDRLIGAFEDLVSRPFWNAWIADVAFHALAALLPLVDDDRVNGASAVLREIAERPPDALIHQSMSRSLHEMDWDRLRRDEKQGWRRYVERYLAARDDHVFPARSAAIELIKAGDRQALQHVMRAYREGRSLLLAPIVLAAPVVRRVDAATLNHDILAAAQAYRQRADRGEFSLGTVSIGSLLGRAAGRFGTRRMRDELLAFVMDARVPVDERSSALEAMLREPRRVPSWMRARLTEGVPPPDISLPLFGRGTQLEALNLRLRAEFGELTAARALSIVIALSSSRIAEDRTMAARATLELTSELGASVAATVLLELTHDAVPAVRGFAGSSLARMDFAEPPLEEARIERLTELVAESGEAVPLLVWHGAAQAARDGFPIPERLLLLAGHAAEHHLAVTVRRAARRVLDT